MPPVPISAIFVGSTGTLIATDVEFTNNALLDYHSSVGGGGAVYLMGGASAIFTRALFSGNMAGIPEHPMDQEDAAGGAIYAGSGASLALESCEFTNNAAAVGGALYLHDFTDRRSQLRIAGTVFAGSRIATVCEGCGFETPPKQLTPNPAIVTNDPNDYDCQPIDGCDLCTDEGANAAQPILIERP